MSGQHDGDERAMIAPAAEEREPADYRWAASSRWEAAGAGWIHSHPGKTSSQESRVSDHESVNSRTNSLVSSWARADFRRARFERSALIGVVMGTGPITEDGGEHDDSDNEHWSKPDAAN